jgi:phage terminase large subunit-like protein
MKQIREFEDELISFPEGEHDDMVDALVYAIQGTNKMMY